MIRSLYSGISGMKNHQTRMDVTGNNIANVNTTGYKSGRVNFQDTLSQTVRSGGASTNPAQIGTGMTVGSVTNNFTQGPMQSTGRTLDLGIQGNGFFTLSDGTNEYYTREGVFYLDNQGYLVNGDGLKVQSSQGNIRVLNGPVSTISIGTNGAITGTNTSGQPLQFKSGSFQMPQPTTATEATLTGDSITIPVATVNEAGITGDAFAVGGAVEASVTGDGNYPFAGLTLRDVNFSGRELIIQGETLDLSDPEFENITSWADLASKLQEVIDNNPNLYNKIVVSASGDALKFDTINSGTTQPDLTIAGADSAYFIGTTPATNILGTAGSTEDWSGKEISIDIGNGPTTLVLTAVDGFDVIESGIDLATKLQTLIDKADGDPTTSPLTVSWDKDHLVFKTNTPKDGSTTPTIELGGADIADFIGTATRTNSGTNKGEDWTDKDFSISYNGTLYTFSKAEKTSAGLDSVYDMNSLANALNTLIDSKIGNADKLNITAAGDRLVFGTNDTTGIGLKPSISIEGADAADFVGLTTSAEGVASYQPPAPTQEPENIIGLVTFANPEGLIKAGKNLLTKSQSSGEPISGFAGSAGFGTIQSGYLEMSNVDLTEEFTNMITTQRGYQASARVITVSDSLLEELIQLKR